MSKPKDPTNYAAQIKRILEQRDRSETPAASRKAMNSKLFQPLPAAGIPTRIPLPRDEAESKVLIGVGLGLAVLGLGFWGYYRLTRPPDPEST